MTSPVGNARVINRQMIESLARGFNLPIGEAHSSRSELGFNRWFVANRSNMKEAAAVDSSDTRLLGPIVDGLRDSGQLRGYRPERARDFWNGEHDGWYIHEHDLIATPVLLPLAGKFADGIQVPEALNIWVCDPLLPMPARSNEWDFVGSFVFLVEELGEFSWPSSHFISGLSALRLVVEGLTTGQEFAFGRQYELAGGEDAYGRWNTEHPIRKLENAGGIVGTPRRISTVYKIAYMTDEQAYSQDGQHVRVNDILAYPLYIMV